MEENGEHTLQLLEAHAGGGTVQVLKLSSEEGAALLAAAESGESRIIADGGQHSVPNLVPTQPGIPYFKNHGLFMPKFFLVNPK